jgi:hypothetical protein
MGYQPAAWPKGVFVIDLERTRSRMLSELGAPPANGGPVLASADDPAFVAQEAGRLELRGHTRDELLPALKSALRKRFSQVPKEQLDEDLFGLLKKGLGNAFKRGNLENDDKWIAVEVVASRRGALVAIADEGDGFDVPGIVARFRANEQYFHHKGSGISRFHKSRSVVSWEHGGRTLLICFHTRPALDHRVDVNGDEAVLRERFAAEIPFFRKNELRLESCRAFAADRDSADSPETRYVVACRKRDDTKKSVAMLARTLPAAAASREFEVARALYSGRFLEESGIRIPKPMGVISSPSMVLYRLEVDRTLRERAKRIERFKDLESLIRKVASALRMLHASELALDTEEGLEAELERHRAIERRLEGRLASGGRRERLARAVERLARGAARLGAWERAPIHGSFGWDAIVLDRNRHAYLYRLDQSRRSHPGLDLGGFLADLLRFYVLRESQEREFHARGREAFVSAYLDGRTPPWAASLDWFVAGALLRRLERMLARPEGKWEPKVDALLEQLERTLD